MFVPLALAGAINLISAIEKEQYPHAKLAKIYAAIGNKDKMYSHLNSALMYWYRTTHLTLMQDAVFNPYRDEEGFKSIVNKAWTPRIDDVEE